MGTVVRTRSVEFMPLGLSLATLLCAAAWSVYAVYVGDATILVPNIMGVALASAQLALYARYCGGAGGDGTGGGGGGGGGGGMEGQGAERASTGLLDEAREGRDGEDEGSGGGYAPPAPAPV
jgi:hypothetical protein